MILSIKEIIEHYRKENNISTETLAECIGIKRNALYVRYRSPEMWRLGELNSAYEFLMIPVEERKYQ